jgi:hypothetical protein
VNYFQTPLIPGHDPFESRKTLVAIAVVLAIGFGVVFGDFLWGAAFYVVFVTVGDLLSHHVLKIRPSEGSDPELLLISEKVTPEQFDAYFETRRWIRASSLTASFVSGMLVFLCHPALLLEFFCGMYVASTWAGIFWVRLVSKIPSPQLFHHDPHACLPPGPKPGFVTLSQYAANRSAGILSGPIDPEAR